MSSKLGTVLRRAVFCAASGGRLLRWVAPPLTAIVAVVSVSYAQQAPIANVAGVTPDAYAILGEQQVTVIRGIDLFEGQTIVTNDQAQVQIVFADETRMVVGPNSALLIERYLMRDPNTVSEFVANALGGTFRFISGNSPSEAYSNRTPAGTIGVRGTELDLTVDQLLKQIFLLLYRDGAYHCFDLAEGAPNGAERYTELAETCSGVSILGDGQNGWVATAMPGYMLELGTFEYIAAQLPLLREFRVNGAWECLYPPREEVDEPDPPPPPPPPCDEAAGRQQPPASSCDSSRIDIG